MTEKLPKKISVKGKTYVAESVATYKSGAKVGYKGMTYFAEAEMPSEYIMLEGVAYKRGQKVEDFMKKTVMESIGAGKKIPKKVKLKGSDKIFEMRDEWGGNFGGASGGNNESDDAYVIRKANEAYDAIEASGRYIDSVSDPRKSALDAAWRAVEEFVNVCKSYKSGN